MQSQQNTVICNGVAVAGSSGKSQHLNSNCSLSKYWYYIICISIWPDPVRSDQMQNEECGETISALSASYVPIRTGV